MIDETNAPLGDEPSVESAVVSTATEPVTQETDPASTDSETGSEEDVKLGAPDAETTGEPEKQPKRNRISYGERIAQLTKQSHLDALELNALRHQLRRVKEEKETATAPEYESEHQKALREELDRRDVKQAENAVQSAEEAKERRVALERQQEWESRVEDVDLRDKFEKVTHVTSAMCDIIAYSDEAEALTRYFVNKPEEAKRIWQLPAGLQAKAVIDLANRLSSKEPVRRVSQAPEPGSTLKGGSNPPRKALGDLPYAEYAKTRQKQLDAKRR